MNINPVYVFFTAVIFFLVSVIFVLCIKNSGKSTGKVVSELYEKIGILEKSAENITQMGKDITSLNNILNAPKLRGNLGEYMLYKLLRDVLPEAHYEQQYSFKDGQTVDAVIKLGKNIIPVDSKFPLESFVRYVKSEGTEAKKKAKSEFVKSVKIRIDEISKKYIRTAEGTFDFGMMYIPSENVYYEILLHDRDRGFEIFDYAVKSRVIVVSPNTFYTYLMTVVYGLRGLKIEQKTKEFMKQLTELKNSFDEFGREFDVLGKHLRQAVVKFDGVDSSRRVLSDRIDSFL